MKEEENIEDLFKDLEDFFDKEEPTSGHELRFIEKLNASGKTAHLNSKKNWWKPLSIAASIVLLCAVGAGMFFSNTPTIKEQVAKISPNASQSQFYFANLINQQIKELENKSTPETQKIIADTMEQLKKLETNYQALEQDLLSGGNSKLILSAMITNFQTRIDFLKEVSEKIELIKNLNNYNDENFTI